MEVSSNMNSEGVRHRAVPEQENKGRVSRPVLLNSGREGLSQDGMGGAAVNLLEERTDVG